MARLASSGLLVFLGDRITGRCFARSRASGQCHRTDAEVEIEGRINGIVPTVGQRARSVFVRDGGEPSDRGAAVIPVFQVERLIDEGRELAHPVTQRVRQFNVRLAFHHHQGDFETAAVRVVVEIGTEEVFQGIDQLVAVGIREEPRNVRIVELGNCEEL